MRAQWRTFSDPWSSITCVRFVTPQDSKLMLGFAVHELPKDVIPHCSTMTNFRQASLENILGFL